MSSITYLPHYLIPLFFAGFLLFILLNNSNYIHGPLGNAAYFHLLIFNILNFLHFLLKMVIFVWKLMSSKIFVWKFMLWDYFSSLYFILHDISSDSLQSSVLWILGMGLMLGNLVFCTTWGTVYPPRLTYLRYRWHSAQTVQYSWGLGKCFHFNIF